MTPAQRLPGTPAQPDQADDALLEAASGPPYSADGTRQPEERQPEELSVPVRGGRLALLRWPGEGPVVLAAHGLASNALAWARVATYVDDQVTVVAPDLRGRARSAALPGPYGLGAHVTDLVAVLDALGVERAVLAGHSLGAFAAAATALAHPDRVGHLVLVDGGVPLPALPWTTGAAKARLVQSVLRPLQRSYPSRDAYLRTWRAHPALHRDWSPSIEATLLRDLAGTPPRLVSSSVPTAIRADADDVLSDPAVARAVHRSRHPGVLVWAASGPLGAPGDLYNRSHLARQGLPRSLRTVRVDGVNHLTVLLGDTGAHAVAAEITAAVLAT